MTFLVCSAILVILYFALALNVSLTRRRTRTGIGTGDDPAGPMNKAVRAHGNAAEYVPIFVALFLYFLLSGASPGGAANGRSKSVYAIITDIKSTVGFASGDANS